MCSVTVAELILTVLGEKVQSGDVFTAYDVTKEARNRTSERVDHSDAKRIIVGEFVTGQMLNYDKGYRTLETPNHDFAIVYHPDTKTPEDHPLVTDSNVSVNIGSGADDNTVDDDDVITTTVEGRFQIPKKFLKQVAPVGGSYDFIIQGIVYPKSPNADGRVRFTRNSLGFSSNKAKVTVDTDNNTISIEQV